MQKKTLGRPALGAIRKNISITEVNWNRAKLLGNGNASKGILLAIENMWDTKLNLINTDSSPYQITIDASFEEWCKLSDEQKIQIIKASIENGFKKVE